MHIFISYAKVDSYELARKIHDAVIKIPGTTAWMDDSLETASSWAAQIQIEIDRCDYVVLLLSPDVNRTPSATQARSFVLNEIDYALEGHKPIIPVMAQRTRIPVQIAGIQYIDFTRNQDMGLQRLLNDIGKRAGIVVPTSTATFTPSRTTPPVRRLVWIVGIPVALIIAALLFVSSNNSPPQPNQSHTETAKATNSGGINGTSPPNLLLDSTQVALANTENAKVTILPTLNDDELILTQVANMLATVTAKAPTATFLPTATFTPMVDTLATDRADRIATAAMLKVTEILETQAAQAAANLATNTAQPTNTATSMPSITPSLTPTPLPTATDAVVAIMTQNAQQTIVYSAAGATVAAQVNDQDRIRRAAFAITSAFEGGGYATYQTYDSGIISYGRFQFTLAEGSFITIITRYVNQASGTTADGLRAYLPRINAKDESLRKDDGLKTLCKTAAADPIMQAIQDEVATENTWNKSIIPRDIQTPLGQAIVFDTTVQRGMNNFLLPTAEQVLGISNKSQLGENGITEEQFIKEVAQLNHDSLLSLSIKLNLPGMVKRGDFWMNLVNSGDWQLQGDANGNVNINGKIVQVRNPV